MMILHRRVCRGPNGLEHSGFPTWLTHTQEKKSGRERGAEKSQRLTLHPLRNSAWYRNQGCKETDAAFKGNSTEWALLSQITVFQLIISSFPHSFSDKIKLNNQAFFNVCCHLNKTINGRKSAAAELSPSPQFLQNYHLILDIYSHFLMSNLCTS